MKKYYYFGYGMNTNVAQMSYRCPRAVSLGHAMIKDYEFRFARHADVVPRAGGLVDGVLWEITDECLKNLDALEGYPTYYNRITVPVHVGNKIVSALVYVMNVGYPYEAPAESYYQMLLEGYSEHGVPLTQIHLALKTRSPQI